MAAPHHGDGDDDDSLARFFPVVLGAAGVLAAAAAAAGDGWALCAAPATALLLRFLRRPRAATARQPFAALVLVPLSGLGALLAGAAGRALALLALAGAALQLLVDHRVRERGKRLI